MDRKRVLVFPCGSEIGLEIYRSLWCAKEVDLWGGSSASDHGRFVYKQHINDIPFVSNEEFLPHVNNLIEQYGFDYIIPAHDDVVLKLSEAFHFGKLQCRVLTSPLETCRIARSKKQTIEFFKDKNLTPYQYNDLSEVDHWPVFLKPDVGQGSKGTVLANSLEEAEYHLSKNKELLILEYLPGKEYTVDCFTDRHRHLIFAGGRQRCRISGGISVNTKPSMRLELSKLSECINNALPFRGMWFFQVKENGKGELALMEIAPRLAGTMGMYRNIGINFALMSLYDAEGYDVTVIKNDYPIVFDRALESKFEIGLQFKHVYLGYDDCLAIDGKINTQMIRFLFQCVNRSIGITLLTRHLGDLTSLLRQQRISQLFDEVIKVENKTPKSVFVKESNAIFIDDSFAERLDVQKKVGIPVFAVDAVESLLTSES